MLSDVSGLTVIVVTLSLVVTALGEYMGGKTCLSIMYSKGDKINLGDSFFWTGEQIYVSRLKTYIVTFIFLLVAVSRFRNLMEQVIETSGVESDANFFVKLGVARVMFVNSKGTLKLGSFFENQLVYVSEIASYFYLFIFLYNAMICKNRQYYLLLPLFPDFLMRLISTSRTTFLMLFLAFIVLYFMIQHKNKNINKLHIPIWLILAGFIFIALFLWYGFARNDAYSIPLLDYLQMYTCSAIYGLNYKLINGWEPNPIFGFNTLGGIYELLKITMKQQDIWGDGMLVFNKHGFHSNIYTSLLAPIQDFGYLGMIVVRFFEAFICTEIIGIVYRSNQKSKHLYIWLYLSLVSIYCYFYFSTGSIFPSIFAQPDVIIRYFFYGWFLLLFLNPGGINCRGEIIETIFTYKNCEDKL